MNLLEMLESDQEKILSGLAQAKTPDRAQKVISSEFDRLLYQYNENCGSDRLKESAAHMLQTARSASPLADSVGETKVWEHEETSGKNGKKKISFLFWIFLIVGIGAAAYALIAFETAEHSITLSDLRIVLAAAAASLVFLFLAGLFLARPQKAGKKKSKDKKKEQQVEVFIDSDKIYNCMHTMMIVIDKNLEEVQAELEWEQKHKASSDAENASLLNDLEVYAGLLEAYYSKDGQVALDRIADLKYQLHHSGIDIVDYSKENENYFEIMPSMNSGTLRPALMKDGILLKKGLAAGGGM